MRLPIDPPTRFLALALALASATLAVPAVAFDLWTDDAPWALIDAPAALGVDADVLDDPSSGWHVSAGTLSAVLSRAPDRTAYVRWTHVSAFRPGGALAGRWPGLLAAELDSAAAAVWPGEERVAGWGRPEVGIVGRVGLPLLGASAYAVSVWLPLTDDALYPFAARALSLRLSLRRVAALGGGLALSASAGHTLSTGMADDVLTGDAFAGGDEAALDLSWRLGGARLAAGYRFGRPGQTGPRAEVSLPAGTGRARLLLEHNDADADMRLYRTRVRLGWSLPLPAEESTDEPDLDR